MLTRLKILIVISVFALIPTFLLWTPFILRLPAFWQIPLATNGMATIVANYDGPLFLVVAKTLYNPQAIQENYPFPLSNEYYSAHFPLYPFLVRLISPLTGYPYGLLTVTAIFSIVSIYFFYKLASDYLDSEKALWLTFIFSVLPARWLVVRSVGSAETLFIAAILAAVYYFNRKNYLLAGLFGAAAQFTKSPGILLFIAFALALVFPHLKDIAHTTINKLVKNINLPKAIPLLLIPLSLLGVFYVYKLAYNDFFVYFKSGDNIHLFFPPFQIFNYSATWVGTFWLEEIIFVYLIAIFGIIKLIQKGMHNIAWFTIIFFISLLFVSHRDIVRYALPITPFLILGYSDALTRKEFKYIMIVLLIPIYLFSLSFITQNVMPISDWSAFL